MSVWPHHHIDRAVALWKDGHSASDIARELPYSRNAVIGKMHRLGFARGFSPAQVAAVEWRKKRNKAAKLAREQTNSAEQQLKILIRPPCEPMPVETDGPAKLFKLLDWPDAGCRWIYGDHRGALMYGCTCPKLPGLPYCAGHAARAYLPPRPSRQAPVGFGPVKNNTAEFA
jgi:GcrA cell cycle regulator